MAWRDHPYWYKGYLFLLKPAVVFQARVNMAAITYPVAVVTFDTVTVGAYGDIRPGMTVLFGSTAGDDDLGRQRVRAAAASTYIPIGTSSQGIRDGEINISDDSYITVLDDYRIWAKIPRILDDGTRYKDYDFALGDNGTQQLPVANTSAPYAGFVNASTHVITITINGTPSYTIADGATITDYLWDVDDGTITVGSTTTASITATFPAGFRWVQLTVTDSNGRAHTTHTPVLAAERTGVNAPITNFVVESHSMAIEGQNMSFRVFADIPETDYPDGTLVMYWEEEYYNGVLGSLEGPTGREHIKFVGWHNTDSARIEATPEGTLSDTVIECIDAAGRLRLLPGFTQIVERLAAPAVWEEMSTPDLEKYIHYLLYWHSTVLDVVYFEMASALSTYTFTTLGSDGMSLYAQVDRIAQAAACRLTCDKNGRLWILRDQMLMASAERAATVLETLTEDDWVSMNYTHTRPSRYHWLRSSAIVAGTANKDDVGLTIGTVFCIAPGEAPGQGESAYDQGEQIVTDQSELNEREGQRYACRLNPFESYFEVELAHGGDIGFDPAKMNQWARLTLSSTRSAQRGLSFTNERFLMYGVTIDHLTDGGTKRVVLSLERERNGSAALTEIPPVDDDAPPDTDPPDVYDPPDDDYGDGKGSGLLALKLNIGNNTQAGGIVYSTTMTTGDWTRIESGLPYIVNGDYNRYAEIVDAPLDPHNPAAAWAVTQNHWTHQASVNDLGAVLYNTNWRTGAAWATAVSHATLHAAILAAGYAASWFINDCGVSMAGEGIIYLLCNGTVTDVGYPFFVVRIADYGASIAVSKPLYGGNQHFSGKIWVGSADANKLFITGKWVVFGHTDTWATTWTAIAASTVAASWDFAGVGDERPGIVCPYLNWDGAENNEQEIYVHFYDSVADSGFVYRSVDAGVSFASYIASGSYNLCGNEFPTSGTFSIYAFRPDQAAMMLGNNGDSLLLSLGDPAVWIEKALPIHTGWMGGWPALNGQFYAGGPTVKGSMVALSSSVLQFTDDGCATWDDWTWNLWDLYPDVVAAGATDGSIGVVRLTPYWLTEA